MNDAKAATGQACRYQYADCPVAALSAKAEPNDVPELSAPAMEISSIAEAVSSRCKSSQIVASLHSIA